LIGKIFGIDRIRIKVDGPGITTLVGMYKCPLNCEYCINNPILSYYEYTVEELYNAVKVDALYFDYTGGGICFGGHEPLLQQAFIKEFIQYVRKFGHHWKIGIETSLNCQIDAELLSMIDFAIVDIKTMNSEVYKRYTETDNRFILHNLPLLRANVNDITIRLPMIPGYNDAADIEQSMHYLRSIGYVDHQFDVFEYKTYLDDK
jgi:pyruvate formate lyase activating enzyme